MKSKNYSRKHLRIELGKPLCGDACIVQVDDRIVSTKTARIRILDISPAGLRFSSLLSFPVGQSVVLELTFYLDFEVFRLRGFIVRSSKSEVRENEYGFSFLAPSLELKEALKKILGKMLRRIGQRIIIVRN